MLKSLSRPGHWDMSQEASSVLVVHPSIMEEVALGHFMLRIRKPSETVQNNLLFTLRFYNIL
jgi:hypothetical protein